MSEEIKQSPELSQKEKDKDWERGIWNKAGEALAKKLTEETGITHTAAEALQPHAESINSEIEMYEALGTEEGQRQADFLRGRRDI